MLFVVLMQSADGEAKRKGHHQNEQTGRTAEPEQNAENTGVGCQEKIKKIRKGKADAGTRRIDL